MGTSEITLEQRRAARLVGILYVVTNLTAMLAFWIRGGLLIVNNPARTAQNISNSESLFRAGIAVELITVAGVLMMVASLYTVLKPIDKNAALVATFWRLAENVVLAVTPLCAFAIALLSSPRAGGAMVAGQSQALISLSYGLYGAGYNFGFAFLGLGSTLFSYLWLRSRYIPAAIAIWGIFASMVMTVGSFGLIAFPGLSSILGLVHMAPMGIYEFGLGIWLVLVGLRFSGSKQVAGVRDSDVQ